MSQPNLIHSKLARRIFLLFICCALVPIVALAVLSYFHVTSNMRDQSIRRLSQTTKATAMSIYEKLLFLEAELTLVRAQWRQDLGNRSTDFASAVLNQGTKRFKALALLDGPRQIPFLNRIEKPPRFTSNRTRGIEFNKTIIKTSAVAEGPPRVFLALTTGDPSRPDALIVGEIDTAYLWGIGHQNTLPPGTELCVLDHDGNLLISSLGSFVHPMRLTFVEFYKNAGFTGGGKQYKPFSK